MSTSNVGEVRDESSSRRKEENVNVNNQRDKTPSNKAETKEYTGNIMNDDKHEEKTLREVLGKKKRMMFCLC